MSLFQRIKNELGEDYLDKLSLDKNLENELPEYELEKLVIDTLRSINPEEMDRLEAEEREEYERENLDPRKAFDTRDIADKYVLDAKKRYRGSAVAEMRKIVFNQARDKYGSVRRFLEYLLSDPSNSTCGINNRRIFNHIKKIADLYDRDNKKLSEAIEILDEAGIKLVRRGELINEKVTIVGLRDNFKNVFPYSDYKNLRIISSTTKGKDTLTMTCNGTVESKSSAVPYRVLVQLHRKTLEDEWNLNSSIEVKCTCNAFRYNVAYPLYKNKNYAGRVPGNSMIPNRVVNARQIPTFCKHIYAYLRYLIQQKVISM